jgi:DNA primase catalytic core
LIDKTEIERVKASNPIADYLRQKGFTLKRKGKQYFCLCPLHSDREGSLSVDPQKQLWHCFGCDRGGDIYSLIKELEGLEFREAHIRLGGKETIATDSQSQESTLQSTNKDNDQTQEQQLQQDLFWLEKYLKGCYQLLLSSSKAQEYALSRGISFLAINTFNIGYSDGRIHEKLPTVGKEALTRLGVLTAKGKELMTGCLIFPLVDGQTGQIVSLYGRSIEIKQHLYLPGVHRGIVNPIGAKNTDTIILVESVIDALALWSIGIPNVIPIYGTNGLTDEIIQHLKECRVRKVLLLMDSDNAGRQSTPKLQEHLIQQAFLVEIVNLPAKDPSEFVSNGGTLEQAKALLYPTNTQTQATNNNQPIDLNAPELEKTQDGAFSYKLGSRQYLVRGLSPTLLEKLKVNLRIQTENAFHIDTLDLYQAKARTLFAQAVSKRLKLLESQIEKDLLDLVEKLEATRLQMRNSSKQAETQIPMTKAEQQQALEFLKSPNLIEQIKADFRTCGLIGEGSTLLVGYLATISRKLSKPLSILIVARTGAGKSSLQDAICGFIPAEDTVWVTRLTGQALFYKDPNSLKAKVLAIAEEEGAAQAIYSLRTLASDQRLSIAVTQTHPQSGELNTKHYEIQGPVSILTTTTSPEAFDEETRSRFVLLTMDESCTQTEAILARQRYSYTLDGVIEEASTTELKKLHQNAQRMLRPIKVVNPYVERLSYPSDWLMVRREQPKYLTLINTIALLHQYQREIKQASKNGQEVEYLEVELSDIALANELAKAVLWRSFDELAPPVRGMLKQVRDLFEKRAKEAGTDIYQVQMSRRELRKETGWSEWQVKNYCQKLLDMEYLSLTASGNGKASLYKFISPLEYSEPTLEPLTNIEQLKENPKEQLKEQLKEKPSEQVKKRAAVMDETRR